jgi:hypothetical protein
VRITREDLFVTVKVGQGDLLADWRWLLGAEAKLILASSLGDAFLLDTTGIWWLNVGDGSYTRIADSTAEFQSFLSSREKVDEWFVPQLVGDILITGLERKDHQCFSFKKPPVLGGEYEPANFEPTDLSVHFSILGQIHQQVRDLPPGTPISEVKMK